MEFSFQRLGRDTWLIFSVVGATGITAFMQEAKAVGPAIEIILLTITYGGMEPALGFFIPFNDVNSNLRKSTTR